MGIDPASLTAIASVASAAGGLYGAATSNNGAANSQNAIASANLQNAQNQQQYQRALQTIAMQRSVAGASDSQGSSIQYDPATNTWHTVLGTGPANVQNASNAASVARNTTDLRAAEGANDGSIMRALMADRAAGPALAAVRNFHPMSTDQLAGNLQSRATLANRQAEDPIIADTLRQFTRSGTAAGPVLTQMQRDNADTLRKTVMDDTINAMTKGADINNSNRSGLVGNYQALNGQANPSLNFSPLSTQNPSDALSQIVASRAGTAATTPEQGVFGTAVGTNATNAAANEAIRAVPNSNLDATKIASISKQLPQATTAFSNGYDSILSALTGYNSNGVPSDSTIQHFSAQAKNNAQDGFAY